MWGCVLGFLPKAKADRDPGNPRLGSRRDVGVGLLGSLCGLRCRGGGRRSRWPAPRGCVQGDWMLRRDSPRLVPSQWKASCPISHSLVVPTCPEGRIALLPNFSLLGC